ncbi:nucleoporin 62 like isoform X2 [Centroberyx gerrardi]|uniref:nucleoporin 62 like isoform X2 n=1 Tax=Centroberyx gerrardi TaxID=166262 RepID=UPI003AB0F8E5
MSGGFNFGQASNTGFTFGAPKPAAAAPATGFGMATSAPAAAGGGFSFGTPNPAQAMTTQAMTTQASTNPAGGFSFGTPAKSTAAPGGFSFGTPTSSFNLGAAPQPTVPAGLTLGSTAAPAPGSGFTLGGSLSTQTTAAVQPAGGGFSFGTVPQAQPQIQAQIQPTVAATTAPPPAAAVPPTGSLSLGGFSFGAAKVQVTTAAASTAAPGGGFSFGSPAPSTLSLAPQPTAASTAAPTAVQGGGFAFGIKPSSTPAPPTMGPSTQAAPAVVPSLFAAPITTAAAPTATVTGFALGATPASLATVAPATTTAAAGGLSFMLKPLGAPATTSVPASAAAATIAAATTGAVTGFSLGLKPVSTASTAATASVSATITTTAPPVMSYAQLEGLINKWSLELEDQERHFLQQATQVNAWDRMLVENGEKITSLHKEMEKVKLDQRRLNQELDFILSQQKELEDLLSPLEESVKEQSGTIYMQNADEERERTYKLAENVDAQLKRMSQDLKEIIEHLNTSSGPADTSDPLQQICKILNAHMDSLQWIDQNSVLLQRRVEDVSKLCDTQRKEQEKTFRLTFD